MTRGLANTAPGDPGSIARLATAAGVVQRRLAALDPPKPPVTDDLPRRLDPKIVPGQRPAIAGRQPLRLKLQAGAATADRHQQPFRLVAQAHFQITAQAQLEQPQAGLRQQQADHQQHANQAQAQAPLDRLHPLTPVKR